MSYQESVRAALAHLEASQVETTWNDALVTTQCDLPLVLLTTQEGMILEQRQRRVSNSTEAVCRSFIGLGGRRGWLFWNWAWQVRGLIDWLMGGVGMRRGRRNPDEVRVGDAVDFWRVEAVEPGQLLRLRAEMKLLGRAWWQFQARRQPDGQTVLIQTAYFAPKGLFGLLYWYGLYPIHQLIFSGLIKR